MRICVSACIKCSLCALCPSLTNNLFTQNFAPASFDSNFPYTVLNMLSTGEHLSSCEGFSYWQPARHILELYTRSLSASTQSSPNFLRSRKVMFLLVASSMLLARCRVVLFKDVGLNSSRLGRDQQVDVEFSVSNIDISPYYKSCES